MSTQESIAEQSFSYRQGVVLGLTLAEIFLLIVFALLIALASVWKNERNRTRGLEAEVQELQTQLEITGNIAQTDNVNGAVLRQVRDAMKTDKRDKLVSAIDSITKDEPFAVLSEGESAFIEQARLQTARQTRDTIDENWRTLTTAAKVVSRLKSKLELTAAIESTVPPNTDNARILTLIRLGQEAGRNGEHNWPPIINLSDADDYRFESGRAELNETFKHKLTDAITPKLLALTKEFRVDTIEVIGHTDEQAIRPRQSNLDQFLLDVFKKDTPGTILIPADNAGLGLARAASVVRYLMLDGRLGPYRILPLSAGQVINTNENISSGGGGDERELRRIEIRLRRSQESLAEGAK